MAIAQIPVQEARPIKAPQAETPEGGGAGRVLNIPKATLGNWVRLRGRNRPALTRNGPTRTSVC
jgi:hypothetical protein